MKQESLFGEIKPKLYEMTDQISFLEKTLVNIFTPFEIFLGVLVESIPVYKAKSNLKQIAQRNITRKINNYRYLLMALEMNEGIEEGFVSRYKSTPCGIACLVTARLFGRY